MQVGSGREGGPAPDHGVYGISVAAGLVGTGVQNLRAYEKAGLIEPSRTTGGTRLYSQDDIDRLRRIDALLRSGLNLAGIAMVLSLEDEIAGLRGGGQSGGDSPPAPGSQLPPADGQRNRSDREEPGR
jgi:MerR family transcriptional regulator/heat shock protein HspR